MPSIVILDVITLSVGMLKVIILSVVMLNVIMLNVTMLSVIMRSVFMLSVIMLSVVMLNVIMLSVVAPPKMLCFYSGMLMYELHMPIIMMAQLKLQSGFKLIKTGFFSTVDSVVK